MIDGYNETFKMIVDSVSARSMLEQLAEEASELAQAALKTIRTFSDSDNPTPVGFLEAMNSVKEEYTDVVLVCNLLGIDKQDDVYLRKLYRWGRRLEDNAKSKEQNEQRTDGCKEKTRPEM